jgi:hypothetical protein
VRGSVYKRCQCRDAAGQRVESVLGARAGRRLDGYGRTWVPERLDEESAGYLGGVRPLDPGLAGRWLSAPEHRRRALAELADWPQAEDMLVAHGYVPTARLLESV